MVEIGLPYSDPVLDGPVIQLAVNRSLAAGTTPADVLRTVQGVADAGVPALVMTYWNPIEQYGVDRFAADLAAAGGAGLITPDLTPEEAGPWLAAVDKHELDQVFLVAPTSTDARVARIAGLCRGFVYATAVMGVTGARQQSSVSAPGLVARVRAVTDLPVGVGIGVSTGDQAAEVAGYADAAIVGSAFVRSFLDGGAPCGRPAGRRARRRRPPPGPGRPRGAPGRPRPRRRLIARRPDAASPLGIAVGTVGSRSGRWDRGRAGGIAVGPVGSQSLMHPRGAVCDVDARSAPSLRAVRALAAARSGPPPAVAVGCPEGGPP